MLIVQKFGGSSVESLEKVKQISKKITNEYDKGNKVVVVLSAQGKTTNKLIELAHQYGTKNKREIDMILTTGEQQSIALMAIYLSELNYPVISLNAYQAGIYSNDIFGNAKITEIKTDRIIKELDQNKIVIIAGFQGIDENNDLTTLGRGGSDTTAVALASALKADKCDIFTDVDGIYTADPNLVKEAKKLDQVSYQTMIELASMGAKVLHNRSVILASKNNVIIELKSSFCEKEGTIVSNALEKSLISGIVLDDKIITVSLLRVKDEPGVVYNIFSKLAKNSVSVDIILQSIGRNKTKDLVFAISEADLDKVEPLLDSLKLELNLDDIIINKDVAKLSIIGVGIESDPLLVAKIFETLSNVGINIDMISTSEIKLSLLINKSDSDKSIKELHNNLISYM